MKMGEGDVQYASTLCSGPHRSAVELVDAVSISVGISIGMSISTRICTRRSASAWASSGTGETIEPFQFTHLSTLPSTQVRQS